MSAASNDIEDATHLVSVLLLRTPIPTSQGTDPYHDAFGSFCLPSFADSALESGTSTPLPGTSSLGPLSTAADPSAIDLIKTALSQPGPASAAGLPTSPTGRRKGKFIQDQPRLMTHHLAYPVDSRGEEHEIEYCVTSFPILSHDLVNTDELADRLLKGHPSSSDPNIRRPYRGVIVTSQRAVEAYIAAGNRAYQTLRSQGRSTSDSPTMWNRIPFFAVGPATATALRSVPLAPWLRPRLVMGGEATGTGEALASYVIRHFSSPALVDQNSPHDPMASVVPKALEGDAAANNGVEPEPILYLVGDKNAPTIPNLLSSAPAPTGPIPFAELQVYVTRPDRHFHEGCAALAKSLPAVISRPASRRPSNGSSASRPGSRRPSGSESKHPSVSSEAEHASALDAVRKPPSHNYIPSVGTPLGVSTMTPSSTSSTKSSDGSASGSGSGSGSSADAPAASTSSKGASASGGSAQPALPAAPQVSSPATLGPEQIDPLEEDAILKALRSKAQAQSRTPHGSVKGAAPVKMAEAKPDWLVFFSPSGVGYALDEFRRRKWLPPAPTTAESEAGGDGGGAEGATSSPSNEATSRSDATKKAARQTTSRKYPRIAVIGPTTRSWIVEHLGVEPDAVASKPGPKELKEAIEQVELKTTAKAAS